jgi:hypothetical protein
MTTVSVAVSLDVPLSTVASLIVPFSDDEPDSGFEIVAVNAVASLADPVSLPLIGILLTDAVSLVVPVSELVKEAVIVAASLPLPVSLALAVATSIVASLVVPLSWLAR